MSAVAWIFLVALIVMAVGFVIVTLSNVERLRKTRARADFLDEILDRLADACEQLTAELRTADLLAIKQARKSLAQQERIAELEARELPWLDEIRSRAAAHGSQWGPS